MKNLRALATLEGQNLKAPAQKWAGVLSFMAAVF
jgi:hypothetical protein